MTHDAQVARCLHGHEAPRFVPVYSISSTRICMRSSSIVENFHISQPSYDCVASFQISDIFSGLLILLHLFFNINFRGLLSNFTRRSSVSPSESSMPEIKHCCSDQVLRRPGHREVGRGRSAVAHSLSRPDLRILPANFEELGPGGVEAHFLR